MKARIKKTGEIINLASYATITLDVCDSWGNPIELKPEEVELIQDKTDNFDWQSFRAEAAKDILCVVFEKAISSGDLLSIKQYPELIHECIVISDELIKQLKE